MVSAVLTERRHSFGFVVAEEESGRSRDQVTILQQVPPNPPVAPTHTASTGGNGKLPTSNIYGKTTYVGAFGETLPSAETGPTAVTGTTGKLTVTALAAAAGATGWNYYAATTSGAEVLQNATPIAIGTAFELDTMSSSVQGPPTVPPAVILPAGLVLGQTLVGTTATFTAGAGNTGTLSASTITVAQGAIEGSYIVEMLDSTTYNVNSPAGDFLGVGQSGSVFTIGGLSGTITAASTTAVAGDLATIALAANANVNLYGPLDLKAADGTQTPAAILANETNAAAGNVKGTVIIRAAQVNGSELIYPASASASQIASANATLQALGIIVR